MQPHVQPIVIDPIPDRLSEAKKSIGALSWLQRMLPRGKAAIPRYIGLKTAQALSSYMVTRNGARLVLSPTSYDVYATMRAHGNAWDYHDFKICRVGLPDGGTFYEVGANVGYFAVEQAFLDRSGQVYAFEPHAGLAEAIAASASANGLPNLTIYNALVGDRSGEATFYLAPGTIHASAVPDSGRPVTGTVQMPMVSLDDLVTSGAIAPPDMVKMDVEGSEALVFQGAERCFRDAKPNIFIEYLAEFDTGNRIRNEVERLVRDVAEYMLFGSLRKTVGRAHVHAMFPMHDVAHWHEIDSLYILNGERAVRDADFFPRANPPGR